MGKPLKTIITPGEFLKIVQKQTTEILKICTYIKERGNKSLSFTKRFYGNITTQARILEDFLDDYGAHNNRTWIFFRELMASARYLGFSAYMINHIKSRYALYELEDENKKTFLQHTKEVEDFLSTCIRNIFKYVFEEALQLGLNFPKAKLNDEDFLDMVSDKKLPHDIEEGFSSREEENVVKLSSSYLNIMKDYEDVKFDRTYTVEEIAAMIPEVISEEKLRKFELSIHNLQSLYDTYIKHTRIEAENTKLNKMRGFISTGLHLAEIATALTHFYERHECEIGHEPTRKKIEKIIDKHKILNYIVNYSLYYCYYYLRRGHELAKELLSQYVVVDSIDVPIPLYMGFHVRPATLVMKIVRHYGSEVKMQLNGEMYDAGSALDIFRANEKISAKKRQFIFQEIQDLDQREKLSCEKVRLLILRELNRLINEGKVHTYDILSEDDITCKMEERFLKAPQLKSIIAEEIKRLMAAGKIDIKLPINVTFVGDRRALKDIEILAKANYGEDEKGNNIELPPELDYLRK